MPSIIKCSNTLKRKDVKDVLKKIDEGMILDTVDPPLSEHLCVMLLDS